MINSLLVKRRLKAMGLTQRDVARALGIKQPTACQKINNLRPLYLQEMEALLKLLYIECDQINDYFFWNPDEPVYRSPVRPVQKVKVRRIRR